MNYLDKIKTTMFFTPLCQLNDAKVLCNKTKKRVLAFMCVHLKCVFGFTTHSGEIGPQYMTTNTLEMHAF